MTTTTWNIDPTHSTVRFAVRHMVFAKVRGGFSAWSGVLRADPSDEWTRADVEVHIDAASIDTGVVDRDTHLRAADFLAVEQFPALTFRSRRVEAVGGERYRVHGELTIRGITREVVLDAELGGHVKDPWGNDRVAFTATTSIDRYDFGLKWNQALETGGVLVGRTIEIELDLQAVKAAAADAA